MKIELRKTDHLYGEFITYMSYRYAIWLTAGRSERRDRELEQYRLFEQIEFDTPEFHALAGEIAQYLKRKKINTIADCVGNRCAAGHQPLQGLLRRGSRLPPDLRRVVEPLPELP